MGSEENIILVYIVRSLFLFSSPIPSCQGQLYEFNEGDSVAVLCTLVQGKK